MRERGLVNDQSQFTALAFLQTNVLSTISSGSSFFSPDIAHRDEDVPADLDLFQRSELEHPPWWGGKCFSGKPKWA
jgi:hypothetical protein